MRTIWKFPFSIADSFTLGLPEGAQILAVQAQHDCPCLWALVEPHVSVTPRRFRLFGTGHAVEAAGIVYVGTFQMHDGELVFHLFETVTEGGAA